ncbi:MAG: SlyX family protein [Gammaproteobacteria bacterium]|nr:SlyX family protein [Gammaproteobacteria bacterium]
MTDADLERLETKLAYLEQANQSLSDTVYRQQRELDNLRELVKGWQRELQAWRAEQGARSPDEERPPHY